MSEWIPIITRMHLAFFCLSLFSTRERWFINGAVDLVARLYMSSSLSKSFAVVVGVVVVVVVVVLAVATLIVGDFNCSNNWSIELLSELFEILSFSLLFL